jgi:hypothetical protein
VLLVIALLLPQPALAGNHSVAIAAGYSPAAVPPTKLQMRADYVAVPVTIKSDAKDSLKRIDQVESTLRALSDRIKQHPDLAIRFGVVSLSPREDTKSFSSYQEYSSSSAQLYVLGPLKPDTTVFIVTKRIHQVVTAIPALDGAKVILGNTSLGMEDPERFRPQLLGRIAQSTADARKLLGASGQAEIEGLENPVTVMQLNESDVVLFLHYRARIKLKAE